MTTTQTPPHTIEEILAESGSIFETAQNIPGLLEPSSQYQSFLDKISDAMVSDKLKIAVVGVIKSGKSTFVNAFIGKELVNRGAGVVTSITTRIQKGKKNQAKVYLRSWDEINAGLRKLLLSAPDEVIKDEFLRNFDIRRKNDRKWLEKIYQALTRSLDPDHGDASSEIFSIRHALQGFDALKDLVESDETVICFESQEFERVKDYTSDPDKAFYIKDVCLFVPVKDLDPHIEIADCQGADSTDPSQLSRILTYLEFSNLMVYCISSRSGLRESDMVFLKRIKHLGLLENIFFINNCDLTEHETLEDVLKIEADIREDLCLLGIEPELYSFSLLLNHFSNNPSKISKKDKLRLESWQKEKKMVRYCDLKSREFKLRFKDRMDSRRHELLIFNPMKRLSIYLKDLTLRTHISLDLLSSESVKEEKAKQAISNFHQNAHRLETLVRDSFENAIQGLQKEIHTQVHQMFFQDKDGVLKDAREYLSLLSFEIESFKDHGGENGFNGILFLIFKEFQRRVDLYVLEAVKPLLKNFINQQEERIKFFFQSLFESYQVNLLPVDEYSDLKAVVLSEDQEPDGFYAPNLGEIKKILGIQLPAGLFEVRYTSKIKTRVMAGFGLKTLSQFLFSLLDKRSTVSFTPALKKAARKIKTENQKIFKKQFEQFGADLNTHYFFPLIDATARDFREKAKERFQQYAVLDAKTEQFFALKQSEKKVRKALVLSVQQRIERLMECIDPFISFSTNKK
jgi:GTPase SAR1 family protein